MLSYFKSLNLPKFVLDHFLPPQSDIGKNTLQYWRTRIFISIFLIIVFSGIFPLVSNLNIFIKSEQYLAAVIYSLTYSLVLIVTFVKAIPFKVRVWVGLFILFIVGLTSITTIGVAGSGRLYLFAFSAMACLLLGLKAGIITLALNVSSFFLVGLLFNTGYFEWSFVPTYNAEKWIAAGLSFTVLSAATTVSIGTLVAALESILELEQSLSKELMSTNVQLESKIAEQRLTQESLKKSQERYKTLTNNLHVGIYRNTAGPQGKFIEANPAIVKMFGFSNRDEFVAVKVSDLYQNPSDRNFFNEKMLKNGVVSRYEVKLKKVDGTPFDGSVSAVAVKDADGTVKYYDGIIEDITGKRELELQLQQVQKMEAIGTLAGGIAHDFNNILGAILGYAQLAAMDLPENSEAQQHVEQILTASDRAKSLVGQILAFSRQSKPEKIPVDIGIIIKEALKLLRASLPANIEIRHNVKSNLGSVMADQTQIHQIMMNLGTNALHAMERIGGLLDIALVPVELKETDVADCHDLKAGHYLKLTVIDTGHGMDATTVTRIFDPYFTTKDANEGTGLGLATVHGIVKDHGGFISVDTEPGQGTTFKVFLPCIEDRVKNKEDTPQSLSKGSEQILFLDDDKVLVDIGEQMIKRLGYRVDCRTSPYEALEAFKDHPEKYDTVITDMTMPGMSGEVFAKEILKLRPDIPVIICTGFSNMMSQEKANEAGIKGFLMKPVTLSDLSECIRKVLDQNYKR